MSITTFVFRIYYYKKEETIIFYDKFEQLCKEKGLTPSKVGKDIGIKQGTISMWKKRGTTPKIATIAKIADYFGVTSNSLIEENVAFSFESLDGKIKNEVAVNSGNIRATLSYQIKHYYVKELNSTTEIKKSLCDKVDYIFSKAVGKQIIEVSNEITNVLENNDPKTALGMLELKYPYDKDVYNNE